MRSLDCSRAVVALLLAGLAGCHSAPVVSRPEPAAACVIDSGQPRADLLFLLPAALGAAAVPSQESRFAFRQLYQTLVSIDCMGRVQPELAESWSTREDGRVWQFRLREGVRFSDGTPVTTQSIIEGWAGNERATARTASFTNLTAQGERELIIELRNAVTQPLLFAHPDLAIVRRDSARVSTLGTGPFLLESRGAERRLLSRSAPDSSQRSVRLLGRTPDPRSALDQGADALVSSDAAVLEYARTLGQHQVSPLLWSRTYALVTNTASSADTSAVAPSASAQTRYELSRDAVRADTRAAQAPYWWLDAACSSFLPARRPVDLATARNLGNTTFVYPRGDAAARALAERLVALAWPASRAPAWLRALLPTDFGRGNAPRAEGLSDAQLLERLRDQRTLAFVVPMPHTEGNACAAPALTTDTFALAVAAAPEWRITPLLDVRDYLFHKNGLGRVLIDADGLLRFTPGLQ